MKILRHTPETVTVEKDGNVLVYNLDEIRRKAIYDESLMAILTEFVRYRIEQRDR